MGRRFALLAGRVSIVGNGFLRNTCFCWASIEIVAQFASAARDSIGLSASWSFGQAGTIIPIILILTKVETLWTPMPPVRDDFSGGPPRRTEEFLAEKKYPRCGDFLAVDSACVDHQGGNQACSQARLPRVGR